MNEQAREEQQVHNSIQIGCDFYTYFKSNMISSILALVNLIGVVFFLIYFIHIDYLPDLDFSGVMYLIVAISFLGLIYLIYFSLALFLPRMMWQAMLPNDFLSSPKPILLNNIIFLLSFIPVLIAIHNEWTGIENLILSTLLYTILSPLGYLMYVAIVKAKSNNQKILNLLKEQNYYFEVWYVFWIQNLISLVTSLGLLIFLLNSDVHEFWIFLVISFINLFYFSINYFSLKASKILIATISPIIILFILFLSGKGHVISSAAVRTFHMGDFNATVIFKSDYCYTLKSYKIPILHENKISCSVNIDNVFWRVGKESFLNVVDKNITVPSNQIISMTWPIITKSKDSTDSNTTVSPIISFKFNSTILTKNGRQELIKQIKTLDNNTTKEITVYGCSSPEGTKKFNKTLSIQRAKSVQLWVDGYLARGKNQIKVNIIAEGTLKHCIDEKLIKELENHRKVMIE